MSETQQSSDYRKIQVQACIRKKEDTFLLALYNTRSNLIVSKRKEEPRNVKQRRRSISKLFRSNANDIFFGSNSSNSKSNNSKSNLLCIEYKKIKEHPNFSPYCGPMCKDYHESKTKYELKGLLMKVGD